MPSRWDLSDQIEQMDHLHLRKAVSDLCLIRDNVLCLSVNKRRRRTSVVEYMDIGLSIESLCSIRRNIACAILKHIQSRLRFDDTAGTSGLRITLSCPCQSISLIRICFLPPLHHLPIPPRLPIDRYFIDVFPLPHHLVSIFSPCHVI